MQPDSAISGSPIAADPARLLVVGFCAAWCNTCGEFRAAFDSIADARPDASFVWLDIEDDADVAGDIDIENFPTIAVFHGDRPLHFGVSLPHRGVVARLLDALDATRRTIEAEAAIRELPERLRNRRSPGVPAIG